MPDCSICGACINSDRGGADRLPSLFDSIGPVMTGSSSSATAGVLRIGRMGRLLIGGDPDAIDLYFYGALSTTYKGHASDGAVVAGLLGELEDSGLIGKMLRIAAERGIPVHDHVDPESTRNSMTVDMALVRNGVHYRISGVSIGGGEIEMQEVDGWPVLLHGFEDGALFLADHCFSQSEVEAFLSRSVQSVTATEYDGKAFHTVLTETALTEPQINALRDASIRVYPLRNLWDFKLKDPVPLFDTFASWLALAEKTSAPSAAEAYEERRSGVSREWVRKKTLTAWNAMKAAVENGLAGHNRLLGGLTPGDDGARLKNLVDAHQNLSGPVVGTAIARALAVMESNGSMRQVVACPTAGSCGIMPGCLMTAAEKLGSSDDQIIDALLSGAMTGVLVAKRAPVSGALGGCQSEIGVSSAMAAAALAQLAGGSAKQVQEAYALALKNVLGLVCDPVAGPVEVPCIKRNAIGVANAFAAADMALAGIESIIPPDEVLDALINTQQYLPRELRGMMSGGLCATKKAHELKDWWYKKLATM